MKCRTIAVCVTGYDWEYETRIIDGIYQTCQEQNINLLVFASLMRRPEMNSERILPEDILRGEMEIFNLINYDKVDGIVILGDSLLNSDMVWKIADRAKEHHIPVININDEAHKLPYNILLSDKIAMEFVMRHLVEEHGLRRINFIGGFPGNPQTEERLAAYKKVLAEHNIPVEEERIAYGEFWKKAIDCTAQFMEAEEKPEAIVCASDTMALFAMDYLKEQGYRVPEDIVVTGFDGIKDCERSTPTLTTVRRAFWESGAQAVSSLLRIWAGEHVEETAYVDSVLVKNESCGCRKDVIRQAGTSIHFDEQYANHIRFIEFNTYILDMNARFSSAKDSVELYAHTLKGAEFFGLNRCYICICADAEQPKDIAGDEDECIEEAADRTMISKIQYGHQVPIGTEFSAKDLLPEALLEGEHPRFFAFSPLYFKDRYLGYLAYEPSKTHGPVGDLFVTWALLISNNAGSFYMNAELECAVTELRNQYMRDPLTGLYNRRGMKQLRDRVLSRAKEQGEMVTVLCADVDNLKPVNDAYGHEGGDNVIRQTAIALSGAMPPNSICVRTGGDEFCAIFSHPRDICVDEYIARIDQTLADYNAASGLPYQVGCSCGYHTEHVENVDILGDMMKIADANMYKVKAIKKTIRK